MVSYMISLEMQKELDGNIWLWIEVGLKVLV